MKKKKLFILQPRIQHYRVPVFDLLKEKLKSNYILNVYGQTKNGKAFNGENKKYFINEKYLNFFGVEFWPFIIFKIIIKRPHTILSTTSPRNLVSWFLPFICNIFNIKLIGWTKVNSDKMDNIGFKRLLKKKLYSKYKYLILYGKRSLKELKSLELKGFKFTVANNTIDTNYIQYNMDEILNNCQLIRKKFNISLGDKIYLVIGRIIHQKRQNDILQAWQNSKLRNTKAKLFFVGNGPLFNELKMKKEMSLNNVYFIGSVPHKFDYAWLKIANFSIFGGAIGLACQQAMALNTFVIACNEKGVDAEILVNNKNCLLFKKGNIDQLSSILNRVNKSSYFYKKIIHKAKKDIFEHYSIDNMVSKIYNMIIT